MSIDLIAGYESVKVWGDCRVMLTLDKLVIRVSRLQLHTIHATSQGCRS